MKIEVNQLSDCPEHFEKVGNWIYRQWWQTPDNTPEVLQSNLRQHLEPAPFPFTVVAIVDGEPVGSCSVIENDCKLRPQYTPWVAAVFVKAAQRHRGIASAVLQEAFRIAQKTGIADLYIDCAAKTAELYEKNGWAILERDVGEKDSFVMYRSTCGEPSVPADRDKAGARGAPWVRKPGS